MRFSEKKFAGGWGGGGGENMLSDELEWCQNVSFGSAHTSALKFDYPRINKHLQLQNSCLTSNVEHFPTATLAKFAKCQY